MANKYRKAVENLTSLQMRGAWDFRLEIDGAPPEMDILARDLSYDPVTLALEQSDVGARQTNHLTGQEHVSMSATLRDTADKKLFKWCLEMAGKAVHGDGTFGLPGEYVRKVAVYSDSDDPREEPEEYYMFISEVAGINPDRSNHEFLEFNVTLTEWKTGATVERIE